MKWLVNILGVLTLLGCGAAAEKRPEKIDFRFRVFHESWPNRDSVMGKRETERKFLVLKSMMSSTDTLTILKNDSIIYRDCLRQDFRKEFPFSASRDVFTLLVNESSFTLDVPEEYGFVCVNTFKTQVYVRYCFDWCHDYF